MNGELGVFFVDDEKLERILLMKGYDWEAQGLRILGEAASGIEALEVLQSLEPDIVITDINMARMDGLEFISLARERFPLYKTRYIIVTGYREFEYAREAVRLGVTDFLLKPIDFSELDSIISGIKTQIDRERSERKRLAGLGSSIEEKNAALREDIFLMLADGTLSEPEALNRLRELEAGAVLPPHIGALVIRAPRLCSQSPAFRSHKAVQALLDKTEACTPLLYRSGELIAFFCNEGGLNAPALLQAAEEALGTPAALAFSAMHNEKNRFALSFKEARRAAGACIYTRKSLVLSFADLSALSESAKRGGTDDWTQLAFALEHNLVNKIEGFCRKQKDFLPAGISGFTLALARILEKAEAQLLSWGLSFREWEEWDGFVSLFDSVHSPQDFEQALKSCLLAISGYSLNARPRQASRLIERCRSLIHENLGNIELGLSFLAEQIGVNECYLSRSFKREMKESLSRYIQRSRIEESIRLLNAGDLRVYEVADQVGMQDPHYFSLCFKKYVGKTVREYRLSQEEGIKPD